MFAVAGSPYNYPARTSINLYGTQYYSIRLNGGGGREGGGGGGGREEEEEEGGGWRRKG